MMYVMKLKQSGRKFSTSEVSGGHKRGIFCLRCGIFCGSLICNTCKPHIKCTTCGIVCRPVKTYRIYYYTPDIKEWGTGVSSEYYEDVKPICQKLENGVCEDCICWEDYIKNKCFVCEEYLENHFKNFKENGNLCTKCDNRIEISSSSNGRNGLPKNPKLQRFGNTNAKNTK